MRQSNVTVVLGVNMKQFTKSMERASRDLTKLGKKLQDTGKSMSMYLTAPIVALGALSVKAFDEEAQALAKLQAQLKANGKDVQTVTKDYQEFASHIQKITTVGDETTLSLLQLAETMNSADPKQAAEGAIGLSKALGIDLQTATKMAVLAQEGQYTMLQRYVPSLRNATSESEKATIVQKLFADGMEIAKAETETAGGKMAQLKNTVGDLMEQFGAIISTAITPMIEKLKSLSERFQNLTETQKKTILVIAGIVAAIGPVVFIIGSLIRNVGVLIAFLPKLLLGIKAVGTALKFLATNPIGMVITAIGLLIIATIAIVKNWDKISVFFTKLWLNIKIIFNKAIISILETLAKFTKFLGIDFEKSITKLKTGIEQSEAKLKTLKTSTTEVIKEKKKLSEVLPTLTNDLKTEGDEADKTSLKIDNLADSYSELGEALDWDKIVQGSRRSMPEDAPKPPEPPDPEPFVDWGKAIEDTQRSFEKPLSSLERLNEKMQEYSRLGQMAASAVADAFEAARLREVKAAAGNEEKIAAINQKYAEKNKGIAIAQAVINTALGVTQALAQGGVMGIVTGLLVAASGAAEIAKIKATEFAQGGIVSAPTLGIMGEYPNAKSNPEVIAPLSKLQSMMNNNIHITGRISGRDLILATQRTNYRRDRTWAA